MKEATKIVPFFVNPDNMQYLLNGKVITNFNEMHNEIFNNLKKVNNGIYPIYESRKKDSIHKSEYADIDDKIIAKIVRYIKNDNGHNALEIEFIDALTCCKIDNPVIKINGYFYDTEDGNIRIGEVTRLTLSSMNS